MSDDELFIDPASATSPLPHDPFKAIVAPRPIGWISTLDARGVPNLAPYSFFNGISTRPALVMFSSEGFKDSVRNASETREFVCNLATRALAEAMNQTCRPVPATTNEFDLAGLEPAPCRFVKPPRVARSPAALECRVVDVIRLRDADGNALDNWMTIGQVVGIHVRRDCLRDGLFDMTLAGTIARCGYRGDYLHAAELFEMLRPG
jgi:flavin reductase (DIM6/NTAB) family NADH-FMN oxidoreductase RutF